MTVKLEKGQIHTPLWTVIGLLVTILLAAAGWTMYSVQRGADVEHRMLAQEQQVLSNELTATQNITVNNTSNISDLKRDIAVVQEQTKRLPAIESLLLDIERRLR